MKKELSPPFIPSFNLNNLEETLKYFDPAFTNQKDSQIFEEYDYSQDNKLEGFTYKEDIMN